VCTVAVYFFVASMTFGGGVVRCSIQVTMSLSQPEAVEVAGASSAQAQAAIVASASGRIRLTV
jgi:hypothetical protein